MASLGEKFKSINWKEFFIDHCEKMCIGSVGLFIVVAVARTSWSTYQTPPEDFMKKVTDGKNQFTSPSSKWPEDRKAEFQADDIGDVVASVLDGLPNSSKYQVPMPFYPRIWTPKEPISEPKYLRFIEAIADVSKLLVIREPDQPSLGVEVESNDKSGKPTNPSTPTESSEDVDKPRVPGGGTSSATITGIPTPSVIGAVPSSSVPFDYTGGAMPGSGYGTGSGATAVKVNAKGYRFASVRAVFPMKEQLAAMRSAMHLESPEQAMEHVRFYDFELERQTAIAGPNPWSGKWEKVSMETALDVLAKVQFDADVVDERYREAVFTMPLPLRVTGSWGKIASHPQIKKLLTEQEAALQEARNQAAIETAEKLKKQGPSKKGFGGVQHDVRNYQQQIQSSDSSVRGEYQGRQMDYMQQMMGGSGGSTPGSQSSYPTGMPPQMGSMPGDMGMGQRPLVTQSDLLLFRYLDFDVEPGNAYRYRIKLVFRNPLFQRDTSELKQPESANGEFRYSEWSDPTPPVVVADDRQLFLASVVPNPTNMTANFDAFQWMTDTGSLVKGAFKKVGRGEAISAVIVEETSGKNAGKKVGGLECDVLRAAQGTYALETIEYQTPNVLVDMSVTGVVSNDEFPDLELGTKKQVVRLEEAVIINGYGEVVSLDNYSAKSSYAKAQNDIKTQEENFKVFRAAATGTSGTMGDLASYLPPTSDSAAPSMPGTAAAGNKRRSTLKKGGKGGSGSMYEMGSQPMGSQPMGSQPMGSQPMGSQPIGSQPGRRGFNN